MQYLSTSLSVGHCLAPLSLGLSLAPGTVHLWPGGNVYSKTLVFGPDHRRFRCLGSSDHHAYPALMRPSRQRAENPRQAPLVDLVAMETTDRLSRSGLVAFRWRPARSVVRTKPPSSTSCATCTPSSTKGSPQGRLRLLHWPASHAGLARAR